MTMQSERMEFDFMRAKNLSNADAPYGNDNTHQVQLKLIGGRYVPVYGGRQNLQYGKQDNNYAPRVQALKPIAEKPNRIDPRLHSDRGDSKGYYSAQQSADGRSSGHPDSEPTTLGSRRPDSKDLSRYGPLPAITVNQKKNRDSTIFEPEVGAADKLRTNTEYNENYLTSSGNRLNGYDLENDNGFYGQQSTNRDGRNGYGGYGQPSTADKKAELMNLLPTKVYLPTDPQKLSMEDQQKLLELVAKEMEGHDPRTLQDSYLKVTQPHDKQLTGWCLLSDLQDVLQSQQIKLSPDTLRLVASQFVRPHQPGRVDYEKILSFLGTALKQSQSGTRSPGSPFHDREVAKLLRMVEEQLKFTNYKIDFDKLYAAYSMADRGHRGTLSSSSIMDVAFDRSIRLPLPETLVTQILRTYCCDFNRDGQFHWQKFVNFLERIQPNNTGLLLPASKRPIEYAKQLPPPVSSWPRAEESPRVEAPLWKKEEGHRHDSPHRSPRLYDAEDTNRDTYRRDSPGRRDESPGRYGDRRRDESPGRYGDETRRRRDDPPMSYRGSQIAKMEDQLKDLERSYELMKDGLDSENRQLPWFKRFMKMANDLYCREPASKKGYLPYQEVVDVCCDFNNVYNLEIPSEVINRVAHDNLDKGRVFLNPFLNTLQNVMSPKS